MSILLIILLSIFQTNLKAQFVQPTSDFQKAVDLRGEFGPMRDQGDMGFCYAHSTADMLSWWLNNKAEFKNTQNDTRNRENMVSGLGLAITFNNKIRQKYIQILNKENIAVQDVRSGRRGINDIMKEAEKAAAFYDQKIADVVSSGLEVYDKKINESIERKENLSNLFTKYNGSQDTFADIETEYYIHLSRQQFYKIQKNNTALWQSREDAYDKLYRLNLLAQNDFNSEPSGGDLFIPNVVCLEKNIPSMTYVKSYNEGFKVNISEMFNEIQNTREDPANNRNVSSYIEQVFPSLKKKYIKQQINKLTKGDNIDILSRYVGKSCVSTAVIPNEKLPKKIVVSNGAKDLFEVIDAKLNNNEPVYMGYSPYIYMCNTDMMDFCIKEFDRASHASVIVGRLYDFYSREPYYIIRNTWGQDSCERKYKDFILLEYFPKMYKKWVWLQNPVANQSKSINNPTFVEKLYQSEKAEYEKNMPFKCDNGYFLVKRSHLRAGLFDVRFFSDEAPYKDNKKETPLPLVAKPDKINKN